MPLSVPHGGKLVDRCLRQGAQKEALAEARQLKKIPLSEVAISDLELIATGVLSPLIGFMHQEDYERVLADMRLHNDLIWSIPLTLPVSKDLAASTRLGEKLALVEPSGKILGIMKLEEKFAYNKAREAQEVYRTTDEAHPGVARLYKQGETCLAGEVWMLDTPSDVTFPEFRRRPVETRRLFEERGWRSVVAFQTRNPIHRAHEYIQKCALEIVDGLFLNPLVGETKSDDVPAHIRMASYQVLLRDYYPPDRTILSVFPAAMRYAGPREAIFHAIARKNYGCTHIIIGRDHAGVGKYYGTYDAQKIFENFKPGEIGITPLNFEHSFYCKRCGQVVTSKTCPHDSSSHLIFSGTQVREMLSRGQAPPPEFSRPEVVQVLINGMANSGAAANASPEAAASAVKKAKNGNSKAHRRVLIIGLDCAPPELIFDQYRNDLPHISALMQNGVWGKLESCHPPITVPAWASMMASRHPGQLGYYGFRNRADYSYDKLTMATSKSVKVERAWDILSRAGKKVAVLGVPQTYPIAEVNGLQVSCFLTPSLQNQYTYPNDLRHEIEALVGEYIFDVKNFRTENKDWLLQQIYEMTEKRFRVVRHLLRTKPWDFFMFVEMGTDRIHHGFWKFIDPTHWKYEAGNRFENAIRDYYKYIDREIGELLNLVDANTVVCVISDHGAKKMDGGICINEWLFQNGYLALKNKPDGVVPIGKCEIDWEKTTAWSEGGYYSRLFMNVKGREPKGVIDPKNYETVRDELVAKIEGIPDHNGKPIGTKAWKPQELYNEINGVAPDLMIYFGDLFWRGVGTLGGGQIHTFENDTGPDDANHAQYGIFIMHDPQHPGDGRELHSMKLTDVAPTVLRLLDVDVPPHMIGTAIV